ncbi:hypothetical protein GCM10007094_31190 [Pseudovibrio japonicus]|uniref:Class I SAM-dependent methyltransferase n=1 Tax=Pseudovibrio japonicus TaxID=366534 RepID=A0ABQ3EHC1_9HYPH|nr:class I SAM-dependent methyltransferase [Pseudovibrio japonicus]GHB39477.1 hypothetical protein GCM10007094_31190 [Pseudovibrio japonicus]
MTVRTQWRRLWQGLQTISGLRRQGFFIPYRYAESVSPESYPALEPLFREAEPDMRRLMDVIDQYATDLAGFDGPPPRPRIAQNWFARLDAGAAYAMVRCQQPKTIIEIGSGHSTRFMAQAVTDGSCRSRIICIDPAPRATISGLALDHIPKVLSDADPSVFSQLQAGDVLFVDSSHISMPGTDVDTVFASILPALPAGVLVHVHDVVLPDAYPADWDWRAYNEQLPVACLLQGGYRLLWSSHWVATRQKAWVAEGPVATIPMREEALETSIWMEKRET